MFSRARPWLRAAKFGDSPQAVTDQRSDEVYVSYQTTLGRIHEAVFGRAYVVPTAHLEPDQRLLMEGLAKTIERPDFSPGEVRQQVEDWFAEGRIDLPMKYSAMGVIAASPAVRDLRAATEFASLQEMASWDLGGALLSTRQASVERHRGVISFLLGRYEVALERFVDAMERERSAENLCNVLSTLVRLGEETEARDLLHDVRTAFPEDIRRGVEEGLERDGDLHGLRTFPVA
jgi:hypothetical protein